MLFLIHIPNWETRRWKPVDFMRPYNIQKHFQRGLAGRNGRGKKEAEEPERGIGGIYRNTAVLQGKRPIAVLIVVETPDEFEGRTPGSWQKG